MEFSLKRTVSVVGWLLVIAAVTQAIYTGIALANRGGMIEFGPPRQLLWGGEALLFTLMAAFAGSALAQTQRLHLAWSAITASAALNVVQVGVGLTMFGPFREVASAMPQAAPAAASVVAFSFMVYNSAKVLLALALIAVGLSRGKALGVISVLIGAIAFISNTLSMAMGRGFSGELPIAGASGVLATVLLAVCLLTLPPAEES
ncbi:MAG: thiamine biosynthesis protein ThiC [Pseudomonadota bacterium]